MQAGQLDDEDLVCDLASEGTFSLVVRYPRDLVAVLHCVATSGRLPGRSSMQLRLIAVRPDITDATQVQDVLQLVT